MLFAGADGLDGMDPGRGGAAAANAGNDVSNLRKRVAMGLANFGRGMMPGEEQAPPMQMMPMPGAVPQPGAVGPQMMSPLRRVLGLTM